MFVVSKFFPDQGMIDAHCHLLQLLGKFSLYQIEQRARSIGIENIITCTCSFSDWSESLTVFSPKNDFFIPQYGIHPWWADENRPFDWLDRLREILEANPRSGVGEIGLDKNKAKKGVVSMAAQVEVFRAQLKLACELRRTATIHCVNAYGTLVDILREERGCLSAPVVIHSFSGNGDQIRDLVNACDKIFFSVSGLCPRTDVISHIPFHRLLIETDSPCMVIPSSDDQAIIGGITAIPKIDESTNDCAQLIWVADRIAKATGRSIESIRSVSRENTLLAFPLV